MQNQSKILQDVVGEVQQYARQKEITEAGALVNLFDGEPSNSKK